VEVDRIVGLEMGADDYLPKPFNPRELAARIRAILRRADQAPEVGERIGVDDVAVDLGTRSATVGDQEINLTGVEFSLLETLLRSAGAVVSRDELSRAALYRRASAYDRSLDVHISNLRRKLGSASDGGARIKTVRGIGYQYVRTGGGG
jgi:two-component system response regulator CpxR